MKIILFSFFLIFANDSYYPGMSSYNIQQEAKAQSLNIDQGKSKLSHDRGFILLIGATSSLMASILFLAFMSCLRPRVTISKEIAFNNGRYCIKVINKTHGKIYDVNAELLKMIPVNAPGGVNLRLNQIPLRNDKICYITGHHLFKRNEHASYAVLFSTTEDLGKIWQDNNEILHFKIIAKHAFSGFVKVSTQFYHQNSCIKQGKFKFGNSLEIVT